MTFIPARIQALSFEQLKSLAEALLDLQGVEDFAALMVTLRVGDDPTR